MNNRDRNRRDNDALQSGDGDPATGQDAGKLGAGGQTVLDALDGNDAPHRNVDRDPNIPRGQQAASRGRDRD